MKGQTMMFRDPSEEWERFGRSEPYYGVCTSSEFLIENMTEEAKARFFQSGVDHVESLFSLINEHFQSDFRPKRAIDFGCGVGRILIPLASRCESIIGCDISRSMLAIAEQHANTIGLTNIELAVSPDCISGKFDFVHSYIVFQHIPQKEGQALIGRLLKRVSDRGIVAIQLPYRDTASGFAKAIKWTQSHIPLVHNLANLAKSRPWDFPHMEMNSYCLNKLYNNFHRNGFHDVFSVFKPMSGRYETILLIAQKKPS